MTEEFSVILQVTTKLPLGALSFYPPYSILPMRNWRTEDSAELYNLNGWGINYFNINEKGNITVHPRKTRGPSIDLSDLVDELLLKDVSMPVLIRFSDIIGDRIAKICGCFESSAKEYDFSGRYFSVYPIKVNQQRHVVEEIVRYGKEFNIGLEAGSKPELEAVLAVMDNPEAIIICNGYKDEEFIELALLAQKMGKSIFLVVEKLNELRLIKSVSERVRVAPNIGIRIKLTNSGSGKWEESGGDQSKFGLNASELLEAVDYARENNMLDRIRMIHFHLGSQITKIRKIKLGLREVSHYYVQMRQLGCNVDFVDIGGGLGVDYDGTKSAASSSINYSIQEYANDAVSSLVEVCEKYNLPHPNLVTESGRALTAHHSVLIFNVLETASVPQWEEGKHTVDDNDHETVLELYSIYQKLSSRNLLESWHDAQQQKDEVLDLFSLGLVDLPTRAKAERLFWTIARSVMRIASKLKNVPDELDKMPKLLADKYFCNFSLFQSLPDAWAIDQLFPIMPIHRLHERPNTEVTLQDITCDSDGKIDKFVGQHDFVETLPLHTLRPNEPYYVGVFLVGAYQEILGDLHNLFGDTAAVHVQVKGDDGYEITQLIEGETVADVLEYVEYKPKELVRTMEKWVSQAVKEGKITSQEGKEFLAMYRSSLYSYTYLE